MSRERELVRTVYYKLMCDGKVHWITPVNTSSWGLQRIEAGTCNCVKGVSESSPGQAPGYAKLNFQGELH